MDVRKICYLYRTPDKFFIQPVDQPTEALVVDRQTCHISLNSMFSTGLLPANATSSIIYGVVGIKHLIHCPYLIVISKAIQVGTIAGEPIYRLEQAQVIPFSTSLPELREGQFDWNATYVSMLESVLQVPSFYFAYSYDLTNSLQRSSTILQATEQGSALGKYHQFYDRRFVWNGHLMGDFDRCSGQADKYRLPLILGFVSINKLGLNEDLSWILISRRSVRRAGTRFNSRGIDHEGNVSNFVETEQIVENPTTVRASFVQVRGSIPLMWRQRANCKYKPAIEIDRGYDHEVPLRKHLEELKFLYGDISIVNLIDSKGHEGQLEREFNQKISDLQKYYNTPYHYFDFHKECSRMRWYRLNILIERLQHEIDSFGFFALKSGQVLQTQTGVFRSNCIDSLDRTNVVQSMIAHIVLEKQLMQYKLIPTGAKLADYSNIMDVFKNTWADNADALSIQYAGTPALKTDFTRTGQRTRVGLAKDGLNSLTRYVSNNFFDDYRQDAIDLFLGVFEGYPSPLYRPMDLTSYTSPLPVTLVMLTLVMLYFYFRY